MRLSKAMPARLPTRPSATVTAWRVVAALRATSNVIGAGDGNIEAVLVEYDISRVAYADLLSQFWEGHDAAMGNFQGNFKPQ